ncbi:MAG: DNA-processing protein DprA [Myxococcales bacterium]|nr:DNA-processing protein DprA [Myxococcales bacterium]
MTELERRAVLAMWSFQGVGAIGLDTLEALVPKSQWLALPLRELVALADLKTDVRERVLSCGSLEAQADRFETRLKKTGQRVCFEGDREYPSRLAGVRGAPPLLFFKGPGAVARPRAHVGIVGARHPDKEWAKWTVGFSRTCVEQGLVVVSGGAEGIDTAAHLGALRGKGVTWAFVASGLEQIDAAPREIVGPVLDNGGTVFSEYPPDVRAKEGLFVQRNRLIAGSADATVLVRGKEDSGARHTAEAARRQHRPLLAVPGNPIERGAELCRDALRSGALPCFDVSDVLAAVGLVEMAAVPEALEEKGPVSDDSRAVFEALPRGIFDMELAVSAVPQKSSGAVAAALMELELASWLVTRSGRRYEKRE